jgi:hypothetical protein
MNVGVTTKLANNKVLGWKVNYRSIRENARTRWSKKITRRKGTEQFVEDMENDFIE